MPSQNKSNLEKLLSLESAFFFGFNESVHNRLRCLSTCSLVTDAILRGFEGLILIEEINLFLINFYKKF